MGAPASAISASRSTIRQRSQVCGRGCLDLNVRHRPDQARLALRDRPSAECATRRPYRLAADRFSGGATKFACGEHLAPCFARPPLARRTPQTPEPRALSFRVRKRVPGDRARASLPRHALQPPRQPDRDGKRTFNPPPYRKRPPRINRSDDGSGQTRQFVLSLDTRADGRPQLRSVEPRHTRRTPPADLHDDLSVRAIRFRRLPYFGRGHRRRTAAAAGQRKRDDQDSGERLQRASI